MAYWHQDEQGRWYFDWSHVAPALIFALVCLALLLRGK